MYSCVIFYTSRQVCFALPVTFLALNVFLFLGHRNVADLLLNRNAYRDCRTKTGITPLFQACRENHISIVELLLEHGAGVNTPFPNSRENPLTLCAEKGHQELVGLLLTKGAVIDCQTKKGCTPIFLSCKEGHLDISEVLLKQGANVETADCRGNTPIMAAFKNGHVTVSDCLNLCSNCYL